MTKLIKIFNYINALATKKEIACSQTDNLFKLYFGGRYRPITASTSLRVGAAGCAPIRVTLIAAARLASRAASIKFRPSATIVANTPLKVSPAAVVSTASTFVASIKVNS
jgi:hypothetical protein